MAQITAHPVPKGTDYSEMARRAEGHIWREGAESQDTCMPFKRPFPSFSVQHGGVRSLLRETTRNSRHMPFVTWMSHETTWRRPEDRPRKNLWGQSTFCSSYTPLLNFCPKPPGSKLSLITFILSLPKFTKPHSGLSSLAAMWLR